MRALFYISVMTLLPGFVTGQVAQFPLQFEAASMRLLFGPAGPGSPAGRGGASGFGGEDGITGQGGSAVGAPTRVRRVDDGRVNYEMITIKELVLKAFGVAEYQVVWPDWVSDPHKAGFPVPFYNIIATMPPGTTSQQLQLMLQNLLADRLKLATHREKKDLPIYELSVAEGGLKMPEIKVSSGDPDRTPKPQVPPSTWKQGVDGWSVRGAVQVPQLVANLNRLLDHPMVDMTGLDGYYDMALAWDWSAMQSNAGVIERNKPGSGDLKALFTTMEKKLGLRVQRRIIPGDVLVIDHLEHVPTEN